MALALPWVMAVHRYQDLTAWQLADEFKRELLRVQSGSVQAQRDLRYRSQLVEAGSVVDKDIAEGFLRRAPRDFARFLGYALGSLAEAEERLKDGIVLGYFTPADCAHCLRLAKRATVAISRLRASQYRYLESFQPSPRQTLRR